MSKTGSDGVTVNEENGVPSVFPASSWYTTAEDGDGNKGYGSDEKEARDDLARDQYRNS